MISILTTLIKKQTLTQNIMLLEYQLNTPDRFDFSAGQYVILRIPRPDNTIITRLYSLFNPPQVNNKIVLLIELIPGGTASSYFIKLKVGDVVEFQGPAGMFGYKSNGRPVLFLTTGTGIAPVMSIVKDLADQDHSKPLPHTVLWGVPTIKDACLINEFTTIASRVPNFSFFIYLSRESNLDHIPPDQQAYFKTGHILPTIKMIGDYSRGNTIEGCDYYLCGSRTVVESLKNNLLMLGAPKENIFFEKF